MQQTTSLLSRVAVVLVRPKIPENIGAAARICLNMGISRLIVVTDRLPDREAMAKMATHKAVHIVDQIETFPTLKDALSEFSVIVGTTARRGRQRFVEQSPREMAKTVIPQLATNKAAIVFGPEDTGLSNDDLKYCHINSAIPTADFSSINLAQAVAIHCYELHYGVIQAKKKLAATPQFATSFELESMYSFLERALYEIEFLGETGRTHWMGTIRNFLSRLTLTSKDANIIRGICKKFLFHTKKHPHQVGKISP